MSARPASNNERRKPHQLDQEAIQRREMADAAFEHWKRQKDKEFIKKLVQSFKPNHLATKLQAFSLFPTHLLN